MANYSLVFIIKVHGDIDLAHIPNPLFKMKNTKMVRGNCADLTGMGLPHITVMDCIMV